MQALYASFVCVLVPSADLCIWQCRHSSTSHHARYCNDDFHHCSYQLKLWQALSTGFFHCQSHTTTSLATSLHFSPALAAATLTAPTLMEG